MRLLRGVYPEYNRRARNDIHLPALFIGRFQPFHLGHLDALRQILEKEDGVIIGIGSAQKSREPSNPFTAEERLKMIQGVLSDGGTSKTISVQRVLKIIFIPDVGDNEKWVKHVESLVPPFGNVYTGTSLVKKLFETDSAHKVISLKMNLPINATKIRQEIYSAGFRRKIYSAGFRRKMAAGEPWKNMVPEAVFRIIKAL